MKPTNAGMTAILSLSFFSVIGVGSAYPQQSTVEHALPVARSRGKLLQFDFNDANPWPQRIAAGAGAMVEARSVGTIDSVGSKDASGGLLLVVNPAVANGEWTAALNSGPLAVQNAETHLGKLTLSFSLSVSAARPVTVRIESFDAQRRRTGGLATAVYPAAPDFYQHYALDLSSMKPVGDGAFSPSAPFVSFAFELSSTLGWAAMSRPELRLDNVHYARPVLYVSPNGNDTNDGCTEQTSVATPQKAVDLAVPGDIILLMDGTYAGTREIVDFRRGGTPAAWIALKNYPGHQPVLRSTAWNIIKIGRGSPGRPSSDAALAYLEIRGLQVRGNADEVEAKHPADIGKSKSTTNGNGISADGLYETNKPHHLRFADNTVYQCSGAGVSVIQSDWATVENNYIHDNCRWMIYAGSGISIYQAANFDAAAGAYRMLVRHNRTHSNVCTQPWSAIGKVSDGNGMIIDDFRLKSGSPALKAGRLESFSPITDLEGKLRPLNGPADLGAFQK